MAEAVAATFAIGVGVMEQESVTPTPMANVAATASAMAGAWGATISIAARNLCRIELSCATDRSGASAKGSNAADAATEDGVPAAGAGERGGNKPRRMKTLRARSSGRAAFAWASPASAPSPAQAPACGALCAGPACRASLVEVVAGGDNAALELSGANG